MAVGGWNEETRCHPQPSIPKCKKKKEKSEFLSNQLKLHNSNSPRIFWTALVYKNNSKTINLYRKKNIKLLNLFTNSFIYFNLTEILHTEIRVFLKTLLHRAYTGFQKGFRLVFEQNAGLILSAPIVFLWFCFCLFAFQSITFFKLYFFFGDTNFANTLLGAPKTSEYR